MTETKPYRLVEHTGEFYSCADIWAEEIQAGVLWSRRIAAKHDHCGVVSYVRIESHQTHKITEAQWQALVNEATA